MANYTNMKQIILKTTIEANEKNNTVTDRVNQLNCKCVDHGKFGQSMSERVDD